MKTQSIRLFIFSFICFIGVLIFGSILGPLKKAIVDLDVFKNISLFHSHFDQLCWLGSAAIGATFWVLDPIFKGSETVLKIFAYSYMLGTLLFSMGFLFRAIGTICDSSIIEISANIGMISFGGLLIAVTVVCAFIIAINLLGCKKAHEINGVWGNM
jgi:hypothetical protein